MHRKWSSDEQAAVERHLSVCFRDRRTPRMHECMECKRAEPVALAGRTAKNVKDYVHNRLVSLKKKRYDM